MKIRNFLQSVQKKAFNDRFFIGAILIVVFYVIFFFLNIKLGINSRDLQDTILILLMLIIFAIVVFPEIGQAFTVEFIKSPSVKVILIPIIAMPILHFIISFTRFLPILFNGEVVSVGKLQSTVKYPNFSFQLAFYVGLLPALSEELLFRFYGYAGVKVFLCKILYFNKMIKETIYKKGNTKIISKIILFIPYLLLSLVETIYEALYVKKTKMALILWSIVISTLFSLAHGPTLFNFYIYFIPGLAFSLLYLKYGLLSCILGHFINNYLAPVTHVYAARLFYFLFLK